MNSGALSTGMPNQQYTFDAAHLSVTLMIGFIAGILAGLGMGIDKALMPAGAEHSSILSLLGIVTAGYAGTDFIENSLSRVFPGIAGSAPVGSPTPVSNVGGPSKIPLMQTQATAQTAPLPNLAPALRIVAPSVNATTWTPVLLAAFTKFDMTSNKRAAAALGQFLVEAGAALPVTREGLYYTDAAHLASVFPSKFANVAAAEPYLRAQEKLGNYV